MMVRPVLPVIDLASLLNNVGLEAIGENVGCVCCFTRAPQQMLYPWPYSNCSLFIGLKVSVDVKEI